MSNAAMNWARRQHAGGAGPKCALTWLADHYNDHTGLCCPSVRTLADEVDTDPKTLRGYLDRLRDAGLIDWADEKGKRRRYVLHLDRVRVRGQDVATVGGVPTVSVGDVPTPDSSEGVGDVPTAVWGTSPHTVGDVPTEPLLTRTEPLEVVASEAPRKRKLAGVEVATKYTATARTGQAERLVRDYCEKHQPDMRQSARNDLARAVDDLLRDKGNPDHIPAALRSVHQNPAWKVKPACLKWAYDEIVAGQAVQPPLMGSVRPSGRIATSDRKAADLEALRERWTGNSTQHAPAQTAPAPFDGGIVIDGEVA